MNVQTDEKRPTALEMQSSPKVICLGEAVVDRLGPLGEDTTKSQPDRCENKLGGAPANVACALARLGTPTAFIGRLGRDEFGEAFVRLLTSRGVRLEGLQRDEERPTRIVFVRRQNNGERIFQGFANSKGKGFSDQALDCLELSKCWNMLVPQAEWLLIGTIPLASSASAKSLLWALEMAKERGMRIALDINWRPTFWNTNQRSNEGPNRKSKIAMEPLINAASLLKLAKEEAIWLFGTNDASAISAILPEQPDVVITNGSNPLQWYFRGSSGGLEVFTPPKVVDTTGAGDAFTAGMLHQLVQRERTSDDMSDYQIMRFAAACGALVCGGAGAIDPQPDAATVQNFLNR